MKPEIPEEFLTMAALLGESANIDSLMMQNPTTLATNTNTLKRGIAEYQEQQKRERLQQPAYPQVGMAPIEPIPNYVPPQPLPQVPHYAPMPQKIDDGQLEFNLEPSKMDEIIILLKEISLKLTKQNSMLEKINANASKKEGVPTPIVKLGASK